MLQRECGKSETEEGAKKVRRGGKSEKNCACLARCLSGPFGGLLLIKLLLHDAPS